jgi:hypothetical protein
MSEGNEITGTLISIIAYFSWKADFLVPSIVDGFSKGETYIFVLLLGVILLWSFAQAIFFVLDIVVCIVRWIHKVVVVDNATTRERIQTARKKLIEIYRVLVA